jgi:hypothetical protein
MIYRATPTTHAQWLRLERAMVSASSYFLALRMLAIAAGGDGLGGAADLPGGARPAAAAALGAAAHHSEQVSTYKRTSVPYKAV